MSVPRCAIRLLLVGAFAAIAMLPVGPVRRAVADALCIHPEPETAAAIGAPPLAQMRIACPRLADIVEEFVLRDLGEILPVADAPPSRVVAFVVTDADVFAYLARDMRDTGATIEDFGETLYLTAVKAGAPTAIAAARVLGDIFNEHVARCPNHSGRERASY